jgi:hypothetical protein
MGMMCSETTVSVVYEEQIAPGRTFEVQPLGYKTWNGGYAGY